MSRSHRVGAHTPATAEVSPGPSACGLWRAVGAWLHERLGLHALAYPVPEHANTLSCTLGGISLVGFLVLVATGIYLAQFYHPAPADAHASVVYITETAPFGDFVRGVHAWMALLVTITVGLHLVRVFYCGAYKAPREVNWLVGVGLLAITMGFFFTGTVVKWDQEGIEALAHNQAVATLLGALGGWFSTDFSLTVPLLVRVYFAHVAILPALLTVLVAAHLFLIKVHGLAPLGRADGRDAGPEAENPDLAAVYGEPMVPFTNHIRLIAGWGLLLTSLGMALAAAFPPGLGPAPTPGIEVTKPPFLFWWLYAAEDLLGLRGLLIAPVAFFVLLVLVPFLDRGRRRSVSRRKAIILAGSVMFAIIVALSIYTGFTPPVAHTQMHMGGK